MRLGLAWVRGGREGRAVEVVEVATFSTEAEAVYWAERLQAEGIPSVRVPLGGGLAVFATAAPIPHALRVREGDAGDAAGSDAE